MSKVTIATAVLAGLKVSERLNELELNDEKLFGLIGELARSLADVQFTAERVDAALDICVTASKARDYTTVAERLPVIKQITADLVSDQDKVRAAMLEGADEETKALLALVELLGSLGVPGGKLL